MWAAYYLFLASSRLIVAEARPYLNFSVILKVGSWRLLSGLGRFLGAMFVISRGLIFCKETALVNSF